MSFSSFSEIVPEKKIPSIPVVPKAKLVPGNVYAEKLIQPIYLLTKEYEVENQAKIASAVLLGILEIREFATKNKIKSLLTNQAVSKPSSGLKWKIIVGVPIKIKPTINLDGFAIKEIPIGERIKILHKGPYRNISPAYQALANWLAENKKVKNSDAWEVYLNSSETVKEDDLMTVLTLSVK